MAWRGAPAWLKCHAAVEARARRRRSSYSASATNGASVLWPSHEGTLPLPATCMRSYGMMISDSLHHGDVAEVSGSGRTINWTRGLDRA